MAVICEACGQGADFIVGDTHSGAQHFLCDADFRIAAGADKPVVIPAVCELCQEVPPVLILDAFTIGERQAVCGRCQMAQSRAHWLRQPEHIRAEISGLIGEDVPAAPGKKTSRARGGTTPDTFRPSVVDSGELDEAGSGDGVAVDVEGGASAEPEAGEAGA